MASRFASQTVLLLARLISRREPTPLQVLQPICLLLHYVKGEWSTATHILQCAYKTSFSVKIYCTTEEKYKKTRERIIRKMQKMFNSSLIFYSSWMSRRSEFLNRAYIFLFSLATFALLYCQKYFTLWFYCLFLIFSSISLFTKINASCIHPKTSKWSKYLSSRHRNSSASVSL
jgi:hypothetical protein